MVGEGEAFLLVIFDVDSSVPIWGWTLKEQRSLLAVTRADPLSSSSSYAAPTCHHGFGGWHDEGARRWQQWWSLSNRHCCRPHQCANIGWRFGRSRELGGSGEG